MSKAFDKTKGPGVYIPPPLIYALTFIAAIFLQKSVPIPENVFHTAATKIIGIFFIVTALLFLFKSLRQFFRTKNTVILIKPATSLQTTGIYSITRNPMYVGLALVYLGITGFIGNWWNTILFPLLLLIVQQYIIKPEENYLKHEFGQEYEKYKKAVRRWL